jgi:hypothetical protein
MPRLPEPCLTCGRLSKIGNRCPEHQQQHDAQYQLRRAMTKDQTGQYKGAYKRLARIIRETGRVCHLCGKEFVEGDKVEADHLYPGTPVTRLDQLAPAHALCNQRRGNAYLA